VRAVRGRAGILVAAVFAIHVAGALAAPPPMRRYAVKLTGGTQRLDFHGDQATGCAQHGTCDTTGSVTQTIGRPHISGAELTAAGRDVFGFVALFAKSTSVALVHTAGAADCSDSEVSEIQPFIAIGARHRRLEVAYGNTASSSTANSGFSFAGSSGSDAFTNRCAGPLPDDYADAMPVAQAPPHALRQHHFTVDLGGTRSFAAGGFAGTVTSDLALTFTKLRCHGRAALRSCRAFDAWASKSA